MGTKIPTRAAAAGDWSERHATSPYTNQHPTTALPNNMGGDMLYFC